MSANRAVLSVNGNARKVPYSLSCTCELVEEGSFAGVLVSRECKRQGRALGKRFTFPFDVILSFLAKSRVFNAVKRTDEFLGSLCIIGGPHGDLGGICGS